MRTIEGDAEVRVVVNLVGVGCDVCDVGFEVCGCRVHVHVQVQVGVEEAVALQCAFEELEADEREDGEHEEREDAHLTQPPHRLHQRENDRAKSCARVRSVHMSIACIQVWQPVYELRDTCTSTQVKTVRHVCVEIDDATV